MKALPLRVSITLLVVAIAAATILFFVAAGGVESVDQDIAFDSLESTAEALDATDIELREYGDGLRGRIEAWAASSDRNEFDVWQGDSRAGLLVDAFDEQGRTTELRLDGPVEFSATLRCKGSPGAVTCDEGGAGPAVAAWAGRAVEERAEAVSNDIPIVVHGFLVEDATGPVFLVRYEADIFANQGVTISSGVDDLAVYVLPLLLVALGAITWFSIGRALNPVKAMIDHVDGIGADSLDQRVPVPAADDELKRLATTMNQMLDRLQGANERQRQFISDASHELRSPITATGATLEVARSNPDEADWEHVAAIVEEENNRLAHLVDDLLLLARMDENSSTGSHPSSWIVDLDEVCLAEADRPHPIDVTVRVIEPVRINGNLSMLTRAIRNLVDNAAAHATTSVRLEVGYRGSEAIVRVHDDGPGVPPVYVEKIFERFVRVDESRVRNGTGGAGLGLAIARRVAESHGGRLELVQGSGDGATFELALPREELAASD